MYCIVLKPDDGKMKVLGPYNTLIGAQKVIDRLILGADCIAASGGVFELEDA